MEIFKKKSVGFLLLLVFGVGMNSQWLYGAAAGKPEESQIVPYQDPTAGFVPPKVEEGAIIDRVRGEEEKKVTSLASIFTDSSQMTYANIIQYGNSLFSDSMGTLRKQIDFVIKQYYDPAVKKYNEIKQSAVDYAAQAKVTFEKYRQDGIKKAAQAQEKISEFGSILNTVFTQAQLVYEASIVAADAKDDLKNKLTELQTNEGSIKDKMKIVEKIVVDAKKIGVFVKTLNTELIAKLPTAILSDKYKEQVEETLLSSLETLNVIEYLAQLVQKVEGIDLNANISGRGITAAAQLKMADAEKKPEVAADVKKLLDKEGEEEEEGGASSVMPPAQTTPRPSMTLNEALREQAFETKEKVTPEKVVAEALKDVKVGGEQVNVGKLQGWLGMVGKSAF